MVLGGLFKLFVRARNASSASPSRSALRNRDSHLEVRAPIGAEKFVIVAVQRPTVVFYERERIYLNNSGLPTYVCVPLRQAAYEIGYTFVQNSVEYLVYRLLGTHNT